MFRLFSKGYQLNSNCQLQISQILNGPYCLVFGVRLVIGVMDEYCAQMALPVPNRPNLG